MNQEALQTQLEAAWTVVRHIAFWAKWAFYTLFAVPSVLLCVALALYGIAVLRMPVAREHRGLMPWAALICLGCAVMIGEFEKLAEHGVTEREMMRARGQLRGAMVLGGEDSLARMGRLGRAEVVTGRLRSMEDNLRRLEAVTPEEVREMAAWLVEQKRARILVGPVD